MTVRKLIAILLMAALCLTGLALAEETVDAHGLEVNCLIDEGGFVIQIPVVDGDLAWVADDMAQDDSVVELYDADVLEDTFVARYQPTGDGDVTVGVRHYIGIACDHYLTWDLHVEGGEVKEVTGGGDAIAPDEAEIDPFMTGEWAEVETQFTSMAIEKNEARGWDVEITSPMTHGAYIFKTTIYFDCELNAFVYDKGKFWDIPTDYEEGMDLGEARDMGTTGRFVLAGDEENPTLDWYDDLFEDGETVVFERLDAR